jgi:hypothetical protein
MRAKVGLLFTIAALSATAVGLTVAPATSASPEQSVAAASPALTVPVTGTATNALGQVVNFAGQFTFQRFQFANGQLSAVGQLAGTLTNTVTGVPQAVSQTLTLPIGSLSATCQILHLVIGPIDLNLLGLVVHTNQIVLDITAQSGPGNLLGNLLCAVAGLLDSNASGQGLAQILNQILRILG